MPYLDDGSVCHGPRLDFLHLTFRLMLVGLRKDSRFPSTSITLGAFTNPHEDIPAGSVAKR
ncbi:hypothetical protein B0H11DRAFT_2224146 [Mycena galericulata]|nr:hypothetical protein B0H11DRAFT_2224146 [Mycena galericulata]